MKLLVEVKALDVVPVPWALDKDPETLKAVLLVKLIVHSSVMAVYAVVMSVSAPVPELALML